MEDNSLPLAFLLILLEIILIIVYMITESKKKKEESYYEAIADKHTKKLFKPVQDRISKIFYLFIGGCFLSNKELIIIWFIYNLLYAIASKLIILQSSVDIMQLKQGLITMFFGNHNAYFESWNISVELDDYYDRIEDIEPSKKYKKIYYKVNDKIVYKNSILIENLTEEKIKERKEFFEQRFYDYMRYIPQDVIEKENVIDKFEEWFTYLDDVRENF